MLKNFQFSISNYCEIYHFAKQTDVPFTSSNHITSKKFDLSHPDIWGPVPISSLSNYKYYVYFVDDYSRYTWVYLMRNRSEILQIFADFTNIIHTQFHKHIKVFWSDGAREYIFSFMNNVLKSYGTIPQQSCPHQQNGVAERKNRHLLEVTWSLLLFASAFKCY